MSRNNVHSYMLMGDRRMQALEEWVREAAQRWVRQWRGGSPVAPVAVKLTQARVASSIAGRVLVVLRVRDSAGELLAHLGAGRSAAAWAVGATLSETVAQPADGSIAWELERELLESFWQALHPAEFGPVRIERLTQKELDTECAAPGRCCVHVVCQFEDPFPLTFYLTLSVQAVMRMLRELRRAGAGESIGSRRTALRGAPIRLDCELGSIEMPVRDLHALQIGDVIVTDIALEDRARIKVQGKTSAVAMVSLGASDNRKAIKVETTN